MSALLAFAATNNGVLGNIPMHSTQFQRRQFDTQLYLNTAKCQSPPGANKTTKSMNFIKYSAITSRFISGANENGIHHITLIAANNNLEETKMWKVRTKLDSNIGSLKIHCLSSKKEDITPTKKKNETKFP